MGFGDMEYILIKVYKRSCFHSSCLFKALFLSPASSSSPPPLSLSLSFFLPTPSLHQPRMPSSCSGVSAGDFNTQHLNSPAWPLCGAPLPSSPRLRSQHVVCSCSAAGAGRGREGEEGKADVRSAEHAFQGGCWSQAQSAVTGAPATHRSSTSAESIERG